LRGVARFSRQELEGYFSQARVAPPDPAAVEGVPGRILTGVLERPSASGSVIGPAFSLRRGMSRSPTTWTGRPIEVALETLRSAGLSEEGTVHAYRAVVGFVVGSVMLEVAGFLNPEDQMAHIAEMVEAIPVERFPRLMEMLPAIHDWHPEEEFEHGLDIMLRGLRATVE
jgi:hypothetical protein